MTLKKDIEALVAELRETKQLADRDASALRSDISEWADCLNRIAAREASICTSEPHRACPCLHTTPCHPRCTCMMSLSSSGCWRCCSYGSREQQRAMAELLASRIDRPAPQPAPSADVVDLLRRLDDAIKVVEYVPLDHEPPLGQTLREARAELERLYGITR